MSILHTKPDWMHRPHKGQAKRVDRLMAAYKGGKARHGLKTGTAPALQLEDLSHGPLPGRPDAKAAD